MVPVRFSGLLRAVVMAMGLGPNLLNLLATSAVPALIIQMIRLIATSRDPERKARQPQ